MSCSQHQTDNVCLRRKNKIIQCNKLVNEHDYRLKGDEMLNRLLTVTKKIEKLTSIQSVLEQLCNRLQNTTGITGQSPHTTDCRGTFGTINFRRKGRNWCTCLEWFVIQQQ